MSGNVSDNCAYSYEGAFRLAAKVEDYWHKRGHYNVKAEPYCIGLFAFDYNRAPSDRKCNKRYGVRSNLVNGLPPHGDD